MFVDQGGSTAKLPPLEAINVLRAIPRHSGVEFHAWCAERDITMNPTGQKHVFHLYLTENQAFEFKMRWGYC
ncbi:MAG: hypothetical protein EOP83_34390 [Verrucomicrobiaceae bacterium]|nr:MAG: hypothetical protein EOP83_34390 [Verrucomicrobiaceae bacterium]